MLTLTEKIQRLQDCIALLRDVDAMQQAVRGDSDVCQENFITINGLITDFECDIIDLENPAE